MPNSRFTEEQIIGLLREALAGPKPTRKRESPWITTRGTRRNGRTLRIGGPEKGVGSVARDGAGHVVPLVSRMGRGGRIWRDPSLQ